MEFYEKLSTSGRNRDAAESLLKHLEKSSFESDISFEELTKSVKILKPDKTSGEDGIVSEFYNIFWYLIGDDSAAVINEIFYQNLLCDSQYRGMIELLIKSGEREDMKNWRPITLLNTNYITLS